MDLGVTAFARREDGGIERQLNHELRLAAVRAARLGRLDSPSPRPRRDWNCSPRSAPLSRRRQVDPDDASIVGQPKGYGQRQRRHARRVAPQTREASALHEEHGAPGASASAPDGASSSSAAAAVLTSKILEI